MSELVTGSRVTLGHSFVRTAALLEIPQPEGSSRADGRI